MAFDTRRDKVLHRGVVGGALPEHFAREYPNLVSFLDAYYEFMRDDDTHGFDTTVANLIKSRDVLSSDLTQLEKAMAELTMGYDYSTTLSDPRLKAQWFPRWYRSKGSLHAIELFFRWLYGQDATVEYGKNSVFIVGESKIGPQSLKYIKNDKLYQTFALLIKVGVPVSKWREAYKTFAHPAGFYFQGEVVIESSIDLDYQYMTEVNLDSDAGVLTVEHTAATIGITPFTSITGLYPDDSDSDTDQQRVSFATLATIQDFTVSQIDANYESMNDLIDANSPTFDQIDDGVYKSVKFSSTIETMDEDVFDLLQIDSDGRFLLADSDAY